jgi:hypothetical protein
MRKIEEIESKIINLNEYRKNKDAECGIDEEHMKIFRIIANLIIQKDKEGRRKETLEAIKSATDFFEKELDIKVKNIKKR